MVDLPQTFVACTCGQMRSIHDVECDSCGAPRPRELVNVPAPPDSTLTDIRCVRCGDDEVGPWLDADDGLICETCLDEDAA